MEVVIHGTKGGYRTLFKTPNAPSIASDIRNNSSSETALGKSAYSLAFSNDGCVFTKYTIIRDTLRNYATGTIAFSLFILNTKKLTRKGEDIKSILDDLSKHYFDKYVIEDNINKGESSQIIQEDWAFVENIIRLKTEEDINRIETSLDPKNTAKEPAFIFYKNDIELVDFFNKPHQQEYKDFKQILFLSNELRDSSADLLNAIRNSGVELTNIDLNNNTCYLLNYDEDKNVQISVDGNSLSSENGRYFIREKSRIEISYKKKHFHFKPVEGVLSQPDSEIYNYLSKENNSVLIKYDTFLDNLIKDKKPVYFEIGDRNGSNLKNIRVICKNKNSHVEKEINNYQVEFLGEEIGQQWTVSAMKGKDFFSEEKIIIPENETRVALDLIERKIVAFIVTDEEDKRLDHYKVWVQGKVNTLIISELSFVGDEISETWNITIEKDGYKRSDRIKYCPLTDNNTISVKLKRKKQISYSEKEVSSLNLKEKAKASNWPKLILSCIIVFLIILGGIVFWRFQSQGLTKTKNYIEEIEKYNKGVELSLIILNDNKASLENSVPEIKKIGGSFLSVFKGESSNISLDSTEFKKWKYISEETENAILKRNLINQLKFEELKNLNYYESQHKFKYIIQVIDSLKYEYIRQQLPKKLLDSLNLNQISLKLDSLNGLTNEEPIEKEELLNNAIFPEPLKEKEKSPAQYGNEVTNERIKKLKSDQITKQELFDWKNDPSLKNYNKSIDLYLEFWKLFDGTLEKEKLDDLLKRIKSDTYLKNSELLSFLNKVCSNSKTFEEFNRIPGRAKSRTIGELINEQNNEKN